MLRGRFERAEQHEHLGPLSAGGRCEIDERHPASRHRARLVEHDRVDAARRFQDLGAADQDAELGASSGADEQRGGRGEAERARAGDHEHGHCGGERLDRRVVGGEPTDERDGGDHEHHRHEHAGHAVGQALDGCLAVLRLFDEAGDARQRRVFADAGGPHDEATGHVERGADDGVAGADVDRHRLAGHERLVDGRLPALDRPVGGDLPAWAYDEAVADHELGDGDEPLGAIGGEHARLLGAETGEGGEGPAGPLLGPRFQVAPGEQEGDDGDRHLQVEVPAGPRPGGAPRQAHRHAVLARRAPEQGPRRPGERGEHADRHERVHRRAAVPGGAGGGAMERPGRPQRDGRGEGEGEPLPVVELERGDHRERDDRNAQDDGDDEPPAENRERHVGPVIMSATVNEVLSRAGVRGAAVGCRRGGRVGVGGRRRAYRGAVTGAFDGADEQVGRGRGRVEAHTRPFGGEVDGGIDAVDLVQAAFDAVGARCARHAGELEGHGLLVGIGRRGRSTHRFTSSSVVARR